MPVSSDLRPPPDPASTPPKRSPRRASSTGSSPKRTAEGKWRAARVIEFIERLTVPSGRGQGRPFKLCKFQKGFLRNVYEPQVGGRRVVRRAVFSVARKNGKSSLIAGMALAHLIGPEAIANGEIYSAANDREQAGIIFKLARQIVELEPELAEKIEIIPSTKTLLARSNGSIFRSISAEAGTKHGYSPSVVIYDEVAQARNRDLYDVLDSSFGAREEPLLVIISTQSNDPEHCLSKLIDDGSSGIDPSIICHLHAADEGCDLDDQTQWKKANPALDVFRDREDLAAQIRKAQRLPGEEPKVRNLLLNQRISPVSCLISRAEWMACIGAADIEENEEDGPQAAPAPSARSNALECHHSIRVTARASNKVRSSLTAFARGSA
jgi:phage terminase large subunit-like protein